MAAVFEAFGDMRSFLNRGKQSKERFRTFFDAMRQAHERDAAGVEEEWLPYALGHLESWPDEARYIEWSFEPEGSAGEGEERFLTHSSPLHELARSFFYEDATPSFLVSFFASPDISCLTHIEFAGLIGTLEPDHIEAALGSLPAWGLQAFTLSMCELGDEHADVLAQCACLRDAHTLNLMYNTLTDSGLAALTTSPHLRNLRALYMTQVVDDLARIPALKSRGAEVMEHQDVLGLGASLPSLEVLLCPHDYTLPERVEAGALPSHSASVRERVERALRFYTHPQGEGMLWSDHQAGFAELEQAVWDASPQLLEIFPEYQAIRAQQDWIGMYGLTVCEGAMDQAFDQAGELVSPLVMRPLGRVSWAQEGYCGQRVAQAIFAGVGLNLTHREDGLLELTPAHHKTSNQLMHVIAAAQQVEQLWGGVVLPELIGNPNYDFLQCVMGDDIQVRLMPYWHEQDHVFDRQGNLPQGGAQEFIARGDILPFKRTLAMYGLSLHAEHSYLSISRAETAAES